jgi:lysophospholipase L1-like esterase
MDTLNRRIQSDSVKDTNRRKKPTKILSPEIFSWIFHPMVDSFIPYRQPGISMHFSSDRKVMPGISSNTVFTTDKMGFRTRQVIDYSQKKKNAKRIFFFGGSTADLAYLDDKEVFTYLLDEKLNQYLNTKHNIEVEVINVARSGLASVNNHDQAQDLLRYQPDYFVFFLGANDILENLRILLGCKNISIEHLTVGKNKRTLKYILTRLPPVNFIYRINKIIKEIRRGEIFDAGGKHYENFRQQRNKAHLIKATPEINEVPEFYKTNVRAIGNLVEKNKVRTVFLTQPAMYTDNMPDNLDRFLWMTPGLCGFKLSTKELAGLLERFNDVLRKEAMQNDYVDLIDLSRLLPRNTEIFYDDYHFNVHGSKKTSDFLFDYFENEISSRK